MNPTAESLATAAAWAAGGALLAWLLTIPLRRRSLAGSLASIVIIATVASVAAVIGSVRGMFLSMQDQATAVSVALVAGLVAALSAALAARRIARDNEALHDAVMDVGQGRVPQHDGRRLTADIERLRAELSETADRLARARERERALEASRRELVAWVSHDLRTPLAGLRAMSEALEDGVVDDPELYYKQIRAAVERLTSMVDDLFELSRIQAGTVTPDREMISLHDLVSDCVAGVQALAANSLVRLSGSTDGMATVLGNARELNRALTNLVANAIRHTHSGGTVEVALHADPAEPSIVVRDECGGIPPAELDRVFEVGFRGEAARTPTSGGAGLGLAITRGIVEAHGGSVTVENVGGGCAFTLRLPHA